MQRCANLQVFGVVIDQIDFLVSCAEKIPEATGIAASIARIIKHGLVFIPVYIHSVEATRIVTVHE